MRVTTDTAEFRPFSISIEIEDMEEAADLYSLFNYTPVAESCCLDDDAIRDAIKKQIPDIEMIHRDNWDKIRDFIKREVK